MICADVRGNLAALGSFGMAIVREAMWALMFDSSVFDAVWMDSNVSSIPFVVAVGACRTASNMLDASSGWPVICGVENWSVAPRSAMLEAYLEESLDDLRAALRPAFCQSSTTLKASGTYHAVRRIVLISSLKL